MENNLKDTKFYAIASLCFGIFNFLIFAYDIQKDYNYFTYLYILTSILMFGNSLRLFIKYNKQKLNNNNKNDGLKNNNSLNIESSDFEYYEDESGHLYRVKKRK